MIFLAFWGQSQFLALLRRKFKGPNFSRWSNDKTQDFSQRGAVVEVDQVAVLGGSTEVQAPGPGGKLNSV